MKYMTTEGLRVIFKPFCVRMTLFISLLNRQTSTKLKDIKYIFKLELNISIGDAKLKT